MKHSAPFSDPERILLPIAALLFLSAAALGLFCGSTRLSVGEVFSALRNGPTGPGERIFLYVRLPRTLGSLLAGAALAVAGAVIQNVLANGLASPSVLGVNAGAGLAVTLCTALGLYGGWQLSFFAFLGAFGAVSLVSLGAKKWGASRGTLVLMGVAMNSLLGAVSDTVVTFFPEVAVMSNDFRVGDFSAVTYGKLLPTGILIPLTILLLLSLCRELDVLTLGEDTARGLGLKTGPYRTGFLLLAALLAGCAVSLAGLLSFVGLLVPHTLRRLGIRESGWLLGLCALAGGGFVTLCDTAARSLFAPYEVPVGILMAFLGAPFFLFLLVKGKGGAGDA